MPSGDRPPAKISIGKWGPASHPRSDPGGLPCCWCRGSRPRAGEEPDQHGRRRPSSSTQRGVSDAPARPSTRQPAAPPITASMNGAECEAMARACITSVRVRSACPSARPMDEAMRAIRRGRHLHRHHHREYERHAGKRIGAELADKESLDQARAGLGLHESTLGAARRSKVGRWRLEKARSRIHERIAGRALTGSSACRLRN